LWDYPGLPSLAVSYLKSNDFFFSGHVGFPIIIGLEFKSQKNHYMYVFSLFTSFFEASTMIVLRGHYSIDLITGVIFSHYIYILTDKYIYILDDSCIGMSNATANKESAGKQEYTPVPEDDKV